MLTIIIFMRTISLMLKGELQNTFFHWLLWELFIHLLTISEKIMIHTQNNKNILGVLTIKLYQTIYIRIDNIRSHHSSC